ncbi:MAG: DUF1028 domain-containing protein, partial [Acidimicrobiia bacterium]|nr:DUF1028 domain-containing protein [Acidimicrobiia bacterium]
MFVLVLARPADATWSLVAVDPATGEVGVAMASCGAAAALGDADETLAPMVLAPGNGAGVVQGTVRPSAIEEMETLLAAGTFSASGIVQTLVEAEEDDSLSAVRQYAVVVLDDSSGQAGLHSGDETAPASLALAVDEATAQGVRLVDRTVIEE